MQKWGTRQIGEDRKKTYTKTKQKNTKVHTATII